MKFKYKQYGPGILRPVIPVEITFQNTTIPYEVLVDSGADFCIFDAQIGELLGIDIESGVKNKFCGITGKEEGAYAHQVFISVGGWPKEIKAIFSRSFNAMNYGVVGQRGFFDIFIVKFDLLKEEIELKERNFKNK